MSAAPARPASRWSGLDGMRALAVLAVVGFHFAPGIVPGGFLGVDLFFVLSGYLITRMIAEEYLRSGRFRFGRFYLRRARRLLPGVGVVLFAALAAAAFWRDQLTTVRAATLAATGYMSNWWLSFAHQSYFVSAGRPSMLQHLWSLAVEEQFYLLWPVLAVGVLVWVGRGPRPAGRMRRWLAGTAGVLAVASAAEMYVLARATDAPIGADASRLYYGTDTHSMGLLLGAAAGAFVAGRGTEPNGADTPPRRHLGLTDAVAAAALAALAVTTFTVGETDPRLYRGGFLLVALLGSAGAAAVARPGSRLGRGLDVPPLRWLAARSYAIYLWHWPVAVVTRPGVDLHGPAPATFVLRLAVTVALADATYRFVERPIRRLGVRRSLRNGAHRVGRIIAGDAPIGSRLAAAAVVALALLAGSIVVTAPRPTLSAGQRALAATPGGRNLPIGSASSRPPALASPVARVVSGIGTELPVATSSAPLRVRPAAARPQRRALPHVSAYGDSVLLGARRALNDRFPGGRLDAIEGRQPDPILRDIERDAKSGRLYPLVVIGVGDNGLITPDRLRRALACLRTVPRVVVVNNRVGRPWEAPNNRTIARVVPHFANARLLDWHRLSGGHRSWFVDDRIHLTPRGAAAYGRLIAGAAGRP